MSLDEAVRLTEILMGLAFAQQSLEYLMSNIVRDRLLFVSRILLSLLLLVGFETVWMISLLFLLALMMLHRFQGPYNGGSDRMGLLMLSCLLLVHLAPSQNWREIAFGYLALQLVLSYFISGWVKLINPAWRHGSALREVFDYSAYPVSESLRGWADSPRLLKSASWGVMGFELLFPITLLSYPSLVVGLVIAAGFHFANACLFGLNRFLWIWVAAYPSIVWFQQRVFH